MANTNAPFGFRLFGRRDGGQPTAGMDTLTVISSDTNTYFTGDVVTISSQSIVAGAITKPSSGVTIGSPVQGIFLGCEVFLSQLGRNQWLPNFTGNIGSSAPGKAYVCTDPDQVFIVQGSSNAVLGTSTIGLNIGWDAASQANGNTATGISGIVLASSTVSGNSSLPFRIVDVYSNYAPPGANGTSSGAEGFQIMVVQGNNWARRALVGVST